MVPLCASHVWSGCYITHHIHCKLLQGKDCLATLGNMTFGSTLEISMIFYNCILQEWSYWWRPRKKILLWRLWECNTYMLIDVSFTLVFGFCSSASIFFYILEMWIVLLIFVVYDFTWGAFQDVILHGFTTKFHYASQPIIILIWVQNISCNAYFDNA